LFIYCNYICSVIGLGTINPFALTVRTQSPANNLFAARAQQEEQSRRVTIGQLQAASATASQFAPPPPQSSGSVLPTPMIPTGGSSWSTGAPPSAYQSQPVYLQNQAQQQAAVYQNQSVYQQQQPIYQQQQQQQMPYPQQHNPFI